jgi:hypothetical protein
MDINTDPSEARRVRDLWFEDGNIIIQAGNSQFRLYRGILSARSPVFHDMLAIPQPPDCELVDGCPIVRLPDPESQVTPFCGQHLTRSKWFFVAYNCSSAHPS